MAGVLRINAGTEAGGPIFDGRADALLNQWAHDTADELGKLGEAKLRAFPMDKSGRASGGFQANIHAITDGPESHIRGPMIRGVTWSPWLEGTSSRNQPTGFGGYRLFRKTRLDLQKAAAGVGEKHAGRLIAEMGGG